MAEDERGWYEDPKGHAKAGKQGGDKVASERGSGFYEDIAQQQGQENNPGNFANRDTQEVREAGREGGKKSRRNQ